jgi:hypothetical protein
VILLPFYVIAGARMQAYHAMISNQAQEKLYWLVCMRLAWQGCSSV